MKKRIFVCCLLAIFLAGCTAPAVRPGEMTPETTRDLPLLIDPLPEDTSTEGTTQQTTGTDSDQQSPTETKQELTVDISEIPSADETTSATEASQEQTEAATEITEPTDAPTEAATTPPKDADGYYNVIVRP